ncbi:MAG: phosphotransferase [Lachnospiraceae bacterium]|nr:phosphotransferase [Lachnospiraceae bacterium]
MEEICREFLLSGIREVTPFGDGHVNETFLVKTGEGRYVCQHVRKAMDIGILEHNYLLYSKSCREADWPCPAWMNTREGAYFYTDGSGEHWRMYPLIEGEVRAMPLSDEELFACGQGLGKMHQILQTLSEKPCAVYPMLHDLGHYYERYSNLFHGGSLLEGQRDPVLEDLIRSKIDGFLKLRLRKDHVIHGDPKLANVLFQNGKVKALIDLDTVMQGSLLEDVADCIRSCCIREGRLDGPSAKLLIQGYQSAENGLLSPEEIRLLPKVTEKICIELGLRYYTDSISENKSFREKYPGYLHEKAKSNLMVGL